MLPPTSPEGELTVWIVILLAMQAASQTGHSYAFNLDKERIMGKYFIAWLLGVPGIVLVLLYFFFR
jgi:hypothetical protein